MIKTPIECIDDETAFVKTPLFGRVIPIEAAIKAMYAYHKQFEPIKVNCLHAICPNCGSNIDVIPASGTFIQK